MRPIDGDALRKIYCEYFNTVNPEDPGEAVEAVGGCVMALDAAPTIDAVPVVHARWNKAYRSGYVPNDGKPICSNCDCWNGGETTYCPRCGAKMDADAPERAGRDGRDG